MSITKILSNKDLDDSAKLERVAEIVASAREAYGNAEAEIPDVRVNTTHGSLPFAQLEESSKVEILMNEAMNIKAHAIAASEDNPGVVLNKKVQELLATNSFFVNASAGSAFEYL